VFFARNLDRGVHSRVGQSGASPETDTGPRFSLAPGVAALTSGVPTRDADPIRDIAACRFVQEAVTAAPAAGDRDRDRTVGLHVLDGRRRSPGSGRR
jgi:hypothetical protein